MKVLRQNLDCYVFRPAFQRFHSWNQQKTSEKNTKKHVFVYSSNLVDMQKLVDSLRGYLEIVFFSVDFNPLKTLSYL